jgi:hypothetical protein
MTEIHKAWLTPDAHKRLKDELAALIAQRAGQPSSPGRERLKEEGRDSVDDLSLGQF